MKYTMVFGILAVVISLVSVSMAQGFEYVAYPSNALRIADKVDVEASCLRNNGTHCTCIEKTYHPLESQGGGSCMVGAARTGFACACPGTSWCEVTNFQCEKANADVPSTLFVEGQPVSCTLDLAGACTKVQDLSVCNKYVNVYIDGERRGCIETVPVDVNVDDAYGYQDSKATSIDTVELDFINIRFIRTLTDSELHFCVIYGNWQIGEDLYNEPDKNDFNRKVKAHVTASYPLNLEIRDDPNDFYEGDGTTDVFTSHTFYVYKSDGFCMGPLLGDGSGVRAHFYDVNKLFGVNVQTYNEQNDVIANLGKWYWRDHVDNPDAELDSTSRANGNEQVTVEMRPTCSCSLA